MTSIGAPAAAAPQVDVAPAADAAYCAPEVGSFSGFMQHIEHVQPQPVVSNATLPALVHEADAYLLEPAESMDTDVFGWWSKIGRVRYPHLSKLVRQFLGCPASSASTERVFSLASRVFGDQNQNLTPLNLEERMWAKSNRDKMAGIR